MDIDHSLIPLKEIHIHAAFSNLFPKSLPLLYGLKKHIRDHGFDEAFPLILGYGPWTQHDVLIDGHCRRQVCAELGIEKVPVVRRYFESEDEALEYMIHIQKDRRNLTDGEILSCLEVLDKKKTAGRPKKLAQGCAINSENGKPAEELAQSCATFQKGKSAAELASTLGISTRKLEMARTVADHGDANIKEGIASKRLSINKAYQQIQTRRKMEQTLTELQKPAEAAEATDNPPEEDKEHDMVHDLTSEVNDPEEDARSECWIADIIDSLDSASIDYVVVGEGIPPANLAEGQQIFVAPWMAATQRETVNDVEDVPNDEAAPPHKPSIVNLSNYDAEGWDALEQAWAKYVPGLVPEAPEEAEEKNVIGETIVEEEPSQKMDQTSDPTDEANLIPSVETEVEPALDPGIAQILDLKAKEGSGNVITEFLTQRGFIHTGSLDGIQIDRDRLLVYLLDRNANNVKGFSALLAEFQTGPRIVLPPDEDLQIDLHNSFFHFPYGAQWFWANCLTKDDSGLSLREGGFGANVLAFMTEHGLKDLDGIVQKVAQMHEELRPKRSAL